MGNQSSQINLKSSTLLTLLQLKHNPNNIPFTNQFIQILNDIPICLAQKYVLEIDKQQGKEQFNEQSKLKQLKGVQNNKNKSNLIRNSNNNSNKYSHTNHSFTIRQINTNKFYTLKKLLFYQHKQHVIQRFQNQLKNRNKNINKSQYIIGYQTYFITYQQQLCSKLSSLYIIIRSKQHLTTLKDFLKIQNKHRFTLEQTWKILQSCISAFSCFQRQKIRFSKVKPQNIILFTSTLYNNQQTKKQIQQVKIFDPMIQLSSEQIYQNYTDQIYQVVTKKHFNIYQALKNRHLFIQNSFQQRDGFCSENICSNYDQKYHHKSFFTTQLKPSKMDINLQQDYFQDTNENKNNNNSKPYIPTSSLTSYYQKFSPPLISPQEYKLVQNGVINVNYDHYKSDVYVFGCILFSILWNDYHLYKQKKLGHHHNHSKSNLSQNKNIINQQKINHLKKFQALYKNVSVDQKYQEITKKFEQLKNDFYFDQNQINNNNNSLNKNSLKTKIMYILQKMLQEEVSNRFNWLQLFRQINKLSQEKIKQQQIKFISQRQHSKQTKKFQFEKQMLMSNQKLRYNKNQHKKFQTGSKNNSMKMAEKIDFKCINSNKYSRQNIKINENENENEKAIGGFFQQYNNISQKNNPIKQKMNNQIQKLNLSVSKKQNNGEQQTNLRKDTQKNQINNKNAYFNTSLLNYQQNNQNSKQKLLSNNDNAIFIIDDMDDKITVKKRGIARHNNANKSNNKLYTQKNQQFRSKSSNYKENQFLYPNNLQKNNQKKIEISLSNCYTSRNFDHSKLKKGNKPITNNQRQLNRQQTTRINSPVIILGNKKLINSLKPKQNKIQGIIQEKSFSNLTKINYNNQEPIIQNKKNDQSFLKSQFFTTLHREMPRSISQTQFPSLSLSEHKINNNISTQINKFQHKKQEKIQRQYKYDQFKFNYNNFKQTTQPKKGIYIQSTGQFIPFYQHNNNGYYNSSKNQFKKTWNPLQNSKNEVYSQLLNQSDEKNSNQSSYVFGEKFSNLMKKKSKQVLSMHDSSPTSNLNSNQNSNLNSNQNSHIFNLDKIKQESQQTKQKQIFSNELYQQLGNKMKKKSPQQNETSKIRQQVQGLNNSQQSSHVQEQISSIQNKDSEHQQSIEQEEEDMVLNSNMNGLQFASYQIKKNQTNKFKGQIQQQKNMKFNKIPDQENQQQQQDQIYTSPCQNNQNQNQLRQQFIEAAKQEDPQADSVLKVEDISQFGKIQYDDGGYYLGNLVNGKKNGYGQLTYPQSNRFAYIGQWKNDCFHGYGHLFNQFPQQIPKRTQSLKNDEDFLSIAKQVNFLNFNKIGNKWLKYFGKFDMDNKSGRGTIFFTNGYKFCGHFLDNRVHGQGILLKQTKNKKTQKKVSQVSIQRSERQSITYIQEKDKQLQDQLLHVPLQDVFEKPRQIYTQVKIFDKIILRGIWQHNQLVKIQNYKEDENI